MSPFSKTPIRPSSAQPARGKPLLRASALVLALGIACCSPPPPEPAPAPPPPPPPVRAEPAPLPPEPQYENWLDAPQTLGDWTYRETATASYALFGQPGEGARFGMECNKPARTIRLVRSGSATGGVAMRIRTETAERMLAGNAVADGTPTIEVQLQASDPLLDAMAFSRGRFAVEAAGLETLYIPAWAEVTRVIEDCR
jgi:hypothetical protein